jgi:hypothetical protein
MKKNIFLISLLIVLLITAFVAADIGYQEYTVKDGETFMEICEELLLDCEANWQQLLKYNGLNFPTDVVAGMVLKIPNSLSKDRYAKVQFIDGEVEVFDIDEDEWVKVRTNYVLAEGDILRTDEGSKCEVKLDDGTLLKLDPETVIALGEFDFSEEGSDTLLDVISGSVLMKITKLGDGDSFDVNTVSAVAGVRGTEFNVTVDGLDEDAVVEISVLEGKVAAKAKSDIGDENELVLEAPSGEEDTSTGQIVEEEGGRTDIDSEKTIAVDAGYTLQFNWNTSEAVVTKVPGQIEDINVEEVD